MRHSAKSTTFYRLLNKAVYVSLLPDCWCYFSQATHWGSGWNQGYVYELRAGHFHILDHYLTQEEVKTSDK